MAIRYSNEVLPVPPERVPHFWKSLTMISFPGIPGFDKHRLRSRLVAGQDQLWVSCEPAQICGRPGPYARLNCAIVTTISERPPSKHRIFRRQDPADMRSLIIHVMSARGITVWLENAIASINRYAREHGCRMLFILGHKGWRRFLTRWYSREWEVVAFARDRSTQSKCRRLRFRNRPGRFLPMVPVPAAKWNRCLYTLVGTCYFKERTDEPQAA